ncbi:MAG: hypothetical protein ABIH36_01105 [bacterium]
MAKPLGSVLTRPPLEQDQLIEKSFTLPRPVKSLFNAERTGAYIIGLAKAYRLSTDQAHSIALMILTVGLGEKTLAQLASLLSTELKLSNDKAQKMAREIEEDLFGPVMKELEEYWQRQKSGPPAPEASAGETGARNVLNLKEQKKPPAPPPMPR